ncbi:MAG TPA: hypothetical protein DEV87_03605 [Clostridiales bacterium]|nr:hypothetical protein [Clostridiales bacterium]
MTDIVLPLIKYFTIFIDAAIIFNSISRKRINGKIAVIDVSFAFLAGALSVFLVKRLKVAIPVEILIVLLVNSLIKVKFAPINLFSFCCIALSGSLVLVLVSLILLYLPVCLIALFVKNDSVLLIVQNILVCSSQLAITMVIVKISKFKKWFYSKNPTDLDTLLVFSIIGIIIASLWNMKNDYSSTLNILIVLALAVGLLLVFGIKKHISYVYAKRVNMRNEEILQATVKKLEQDIYYLKKDNEKMSAVIHRDNKILPTMQNAVKKVVEKHADDNQKELLATLKKLYAERTALLDDGTDKDFPSTGDLQVDSAVAYLSQKAQSVGVDFFFFFTGDPIVYPDGRGVEDDFLTLLLDLGENAIISAKNADMKLVKMGICFRHGDLSLNVYDSGNKFDERVKRSIGKRRFTTHKTDGGSGIGLMTAYELLRKYSASFVVNENIVSDEFQKCVSVVFNDTFAVRFE